LESGISEARLYRAPYAVDNHRFAVQAAALRNRRLEIRNQWRIGEDAFCILFCGKFIPKKRPLDVVAAVRKLLQNLKIRNVHLLFVGSGILGPQLREACHVVFDAEAPKGFEGVRNYGPVPERPSASFTGFLNQTQISASYIAADCLVLPSDYGETWGLVVNEALASGLPCLVSQACGCAEDLSTFTFPVGDVDALSSRLLDIAYKGCKVAEPPAISDTISSIVDAYRMANS
jgi:glycosyltransferase involved in cell wall biosynthesis